jgi:hypothetical protein
MVGAMISASSTPRMSLTWFGTLAWPNSGAEASMPRMRVSGHSRPAIQALISSEVSVSTTGKV